MDEFLATLVHHWHNLRQAQSSPTSFAYVHYLWYYDEGVLKTKQWYDYNPNEPYRERTHKVYEGKDNTIVLETNDAADTIWTTKANGWVGVADPNWKHPKGYTVKTKATLDKSGVFATDDRGWDVQGNSLWGSDKGPFVFEQCITKSQAITTSSGIKD